MNDKTLQALRASIAHWERMRDGTTNEEPVSDECALCQRFKPNCVNLETDELCPVFNATLHRGCHGTPFNDAYDAFYWHDRERWKRAAQREIDFLKSLLPNDSP